MEQNGVEPHIYLAGNLLSCTQNQAVLYSGQFDKNF